VAAQTLLQRTTPTHVLSRVLALGEALSSLGWAVGSLAVPLLVALGGIRAALIGLGALLPLFVAARLRVLATVDSEATVPVVEIAFLRGMPIFSILPAPALEGLAQAAERLTVEAGTDVIVQGEEGDRFYAVADGRFEVRADGRPVATLDRGDGFGEIALLRNVPRTATVRALSAAQLYAIDREAFLVAVTGHSPTHGGLHELADVRLEELRAIRDRALSGEPEQGAAGAG
jgi:Cyclic nucleotide-binding domain